MSEAKERIDSEIKSKLVELKKHMDVNYLGQKASQDIESFMKKLAEMESRFTTRLGDEIEQKLSELEQRLNTGKAIENEKKHVSIINSYITLERLQTKTYIRVDDRYIKYSHETACQYAYCSRIKRLFYYEVQRTFKFTL